MRSLPYTILLMIVAAAATTTIPTTGANTRKQLFEGPHFECWRYLDNVERCRVDLYISLKQQRLGLGVECCKKIQELGDGCFKEIFQYGPFSLLFGNAVKGYCSWLGSPPSPPVYLPQSASAPQGLQ
ncbi:hypothetical protein Vadar_030240 [Vaccinium darrowii]|uniref:Uncharacterized protein n=1 Tax=Vaccinium darrowii TaxID=229202 RepID=A0ACB7XDE4_9ERIC|nr:hypothetical protein Vadar_030240 [Vaccinium darrowii]